MIRHLLVAAWFLLAAGATRAEALSPAERRVHACIAAAADAYGVPEALILILLNVEGGRIGTVSPNSNDTADLGPMQVNTAWVGPIAGHWRSTPQAAYAALRDNFCANIEGGTWILRQALDEARGDFWSGVGIYHSHNPVYKDAYLRKVLEWTLRLREQSRRSAPPASESQTASKTEAPPPAAPLQLAVR
jgi:soluble lytic murein transglycosylase-like protein